MNKRQQGHWGEMKALSKLAEYGYSLSFPLSEDNPYDIVAEKEGNFFSVQVKSTTYKKEEIAYKVELRNSNFNTKGQNRKNFDKKHIDFLFVATPENCYLIPTENINATSGIRVRKNNKYGKFIL
jgi:hypothetical protein